MADYHQSYMFDFDTTFKDQLYRDLKALVEEFSGETYTYTIDDTQTSGTLNRDSYELKDKISSGDADSKGYLFIKQSELFNEIATQQAYTKPPEYKMVITPELVRVQDSRSFRMMYYVVNIDYNPKSAQRESLIIMNHILNIWDEPDDCDATLCRCSVGNNYVVQKKFTEDVTDMSCMNTVRPLPNNPEIGCILFLKPNSQNVKTGKANYLRHSIDMQFLFVFRDIEICKGTERWIKVKE